MFPENATIYHLRKRLSQDFYGKTVIFIINKTMRIIIIYEKAKSRTSRDVFTRSVKSPRCRVGWVVKPGWASQPKCTCRQTIVPLHDPKPMRCAPGLAQCADSVTVSPSCKKVRSSPSASVSGCLPPAVNSSKDPACSGKGPLKVPEPSIAAQGLCLFCAAPNCVCQTLPA